MLGSEPRPLPRDLRLTGTAWDQVVGGLYPGGVVCIVGEDQDLCRELVLTWLPALVGEGRRAWWYRSGSGAWSAQLLAQLARDCRDQVELTGHHVPPGGPVEALRSVIGRADGWVSGCVRGTPVAAFVVDLERLAVGGSARLDLLRGLARRHTCPVLVVAQGTRKRGIPGTTTAVVRPDRLQVYRPGGAAMVEVSWQPRP